MKNPNENKNIDKNKNPDQESKKKAMKQLRVQRKDFISSATSKMKIQKKEIKAIKAFLSDRSATIPEIAKDLGLQKDATLFYVATLKKYGQIIEDQKEGAFFKYALNELKKNQEEVEV